MNCKYAKLCKILWLIVFYSKCMLISRLKNLIKNFCINDFICQKIVLFGFILKSKYENCSFYSFEFGS